MCMDVLVSSKEYLSILIFYNNGFVLRVFSKDPCSKVVRPADLKNLFDPCNEVELGKDQHLPKT